MGGGEEVGVGEEQVAHDLPSGEVGEEVDQEGDEAVERPPAQAVQIPLDGGAGRGSEVQVVLTMMLETGSRRPMQTPASWKRASVAGLPRTARHASA